MCRYLTCTKPFGANTWLDFIRYNVSFHAGYHV